MDHPHPSALPKTLQPVLRAVRRVVVHDDQLGVGPLKPGQYRSDTALDLGLVVAHHQTHREIVRGLLVQKARRLHRRRVAAPRLPAALPRREGAHKRLLLHVLHQEVRLVELPPDGVRPRVLRPRSKDRALLQQWERPGGGPVLLRHPLQTQAQHLVELQGKCQLRLVRRVAVRHVPEDAQRPGQVEVVPNRAEERPPPRLHYGRLRRLRSRPRPAPHPVLQSNEPLLRRLQRAERKVHARAVMHREAEVAERQRLEALGRQLRQRVVVGLRLGHLHAVGQEVLAVYPVTDERDPVGPLALRQLPLVMGEDVVHAARVYVQLGPQVLDGHGGALDVPAWEALAPRARPF